MVRVAVLDLDRRIAVVRVADDGAPGFPHVLRGTLAGLLAEPSWHVVLTFDQGWPPRAAVGAVVDQAHAWAKERQCILTVTRVGASVTGETSAEP